MNLVLPILAMLGTAFTALVGVVFCLGMGANASEAEIRQLKFWMAGLTLLGAAGIVAGILLLRAGQSSQAAGVSILPAILMWILFLIALLK